MADRQYTPKERDRSGSAGARSLDAGIHHASQSRPCRPAQEASTRYRSGSLKTSTTPAGKIWSGMALAMRGALRRSDVAPTETNTYKHDSTRSGSSMPDRPSQTYLPFVRGQKMEHTLCVGGPGEAVPGQGTKIDVLSSQSLLFSTDGSAALDHRSYSPPNFYKACYRQEPINMDRGCFGHCSNGTNFGCVFDGVTAGGKINAYAAQAFAEYTYKFLIEKHLDFKQGTGVNELLARQVFAGAIAKANNPVSRASEFEAEGGSATGLFMMFEPCGRDDYVIAHGASIGDTAAILCYAERCECRIISTTGFRRTDNARDTGGQLTMGMGINGEIWNFSTPVGVNDLVILSTDGLMDNLRGSDISQLVSIVIRCKAFDAFPDKVCPTVYGDDPMLPRIADVLAFAGNPDVRDFDDIPLPEPAIAVLRLSHYVAWITMALSELENRYYGLQLLSREEEVKKQSLLSSRQPSQITDDPQTSLKSITARMKALQDEQAEIHKSRKTKYAGKTDDAIIVVLSPHHKHTSRTRHLPTPP
eukprot:m.117141 g.117141  ORF g.117141 m.117141 type:complete len:531 (+) comp21676_c0_seq1:283-1875(+)